MNRLLILLVMIGWIFWIVQVNSSGSVALRYEQKAKALGILVPQFAALSELQPIARSAVQSPHAIVPDEAPPKTGASSGASAPQTPPPENSESQPRSTQQVPAPEPVFGHQPDERLRVTAQTSIRSGPSDTAEVIGTAHAGAKLRVKSSEAGWVQFVDPAANQSGWISLAYLAPAERETEFEPAASAKAKQRQPAEAPRPQHPKSAEVKPPKPAPKPRPPTRTYAELPPDQEFVPPRRSGLFGLFWRRRLSDLPPPY
jgi:hypothetical protein